MLQSLPYQLSNLPTVNPGHHIASLIQLHNNLGIPNANLIIHLIITAPRLLANHLPLFSKYEPHKTKVNSPQLFSPSFSLRPCLSKPHFPASSLPNFLMGGLGHLDFFALPR
jgi:hypothetical protein